MSTIDDFECQADDCEYAAQEIVMTDEGDIVLLCWSHEDASAPNAVVNVKGRVLMRDMAGTWFFLPDAPIDEGDRMSTHSPEAIERIAKAICAAEFEEVDAGYAWNAQYEDGRDVYRRQAEAALAAVAA